MRPPRPGIQARNDELEKRVAGAFTQMKGTTQPGIPENGAEQAEDEALAEIQHNLDAANEGLQKLRGIQQKEKGDGTGGAKIDDDNATGSPSMQGMA